jgi:hypothetical protein
MTCSTIAWARWVFSSSSIVSGGAGEHAVVAVDGEQLTLPVRNLLGVQPADPAQDQPGADVVGFGIQY